MTSPVQIKLNGNQEMLFRVPEKYNTGNLPTPNNKEIKMEIEEARTVAAIRFSGYAREKNVSKHKKILIDKGLNYEDVLIKIKIESLWNNLIFKKYVNQVSINEEKIKSNLKQKDIKSVYKKYSISEILFNPKN